MIKRLAAALLLALALIPHARADTTVAGAITFSSGLAVDPATGHVTVPQATVLAAAACGADPTGSTDSQAVLQTCLNAYSGTGALITAEPTDKFLLQTSLTIPSGVALLLPQGAIGNPGNNGSTPFGSLGGFRLNTPAPATTSGNSAVGVSVLHFASAPTGWLNGMLLSDSSLVLMAATTDGPGASYTVGDVLTLQDTATLNTTASTSIGNCTLNFGAGNIPAGALQGYLVSDTTAGHTGYIPSGATVVHVDYIGGAVLLNEASCPTGTVGNGDAIKFDSGAAETSKSQVTVATVSSGAITGVTITSGGIYSRPPISDGSQTVTGGTGTGASFRIHYERNPALPVGTTIAGISGGDVTLSTALVAGLNGSLGVASGETIQANAAILAPYGKSAFGGTLLPSGMSWPQSDSTGYRGTALAVSGDDFTLAPSTIIGFDLVGDVAAQRFQLVDNQAFDGNNLLRLNNTGDTFELGSAHGWPYGTIASSGGAGSNCAWARRSGVGYTFNGGGTYALKGELFALDFDIDFSFAHVADLRAAMVHGDGTTGCTDQPVAPTRVVVELSNFATGINLANVAAYGGQEGIVSNTGSGNTVTIGALHLGQLGRNGIDQKAGDLAIALADLNYNGGLPSVGDYFLNRQNANSHFSLLGGTLYYTGRTSPVCAAPGDFANGQLQIDTAIPTEQAAGTTLYDTVHCATPNWPQVTAAATMNMAPGVTYQINGNTNVSQINGLNPGDRAWAYFTGAPSLTGTLGCGSGNLYLPNGMGSIPITTDLSLVEFIDIGAGAAGCDLVEVVTPSWVPTGNSGGIPYYSSAAALASSLALTANNPVIGGGAGTAPSSGTRSGNTTEFATVSGALTSGNCLKSDASGNIVDNGGTCGGAGGSPGGSSNSIQYNNGGSFGGIGPTAGTIVQGNSGAPTETATPVLGVNAAAAGTLGLANGGGSGATVTIQNPSATGAYNFNLPATVGSSGQVLASAGGGSSPMTWTTLAASATTDATNASNISSGTLPAGRLPNPSASTLGGTESIAAASHKWINTISTAGVPNLTQPACGDLSDGVASCNTDATNAANISSGTLPAGRLPNPSASTLGGIESIAAVSHKWINTISTAGVPNLTQPACGDLSDGAPSCNTDATNASNISSGTLAFARAAKFIQAATVAATLSSGGGL